MLKVISLVTLLSVLFFACEKGDSNNCKPNVNCTEEFRTIIITVKYTNNTPVELDSVKVFDSWSGVEITSIHSNHDMGMESGEYILFDDTHLSSYRSFEVTLNFKGYLNGVVVAEKTFDVGADCCHVYALSEDLFITIPLI